MKNILLFTIITTFTLFGCNNSPKEDNLKQSFLAQKSINNLLLELHNNTLNFAAKNTGQFDYYILNKYKNDALNSFKINDSIFIENTDIISVFYSYNLGTDIHREHVFVKKIDGYYVLSNQHYNQYDDDPFKNGKPEDAKKMLEKIDDWQSK